MLPSSSVGALSPVNARRQRALADAAHPKQQNPASCIRPAFKLPPRMLSHIPRLRAPLRPVCSAGTAHPEGAHKEGTSRSAHLPVFLSVPQVTLAKGGGGGSQDMGSGSSLGAQVLERTSFNIVMPTPVVQGPKLDDTGNGGDMGKNNNVGGGDGGSGGGGDDDDYSFNEGEGEDGDGDGWKRETFLKTLIPELFDRASLGAVLSEWFKTVAELPLIIRRAVEMGLFSSAQLTRFLSMDVRPGVVRNVARRLPDSLQSQLVGRLMADPGFVHKLVVETTLAALSSLYYELQARGERWRQELDLVLINTVGMAAAAGASLWMVAPSRAYGALHKFPWQQMLHNLPNCVFDSSGPLRKYTLRSRAGGWAAKMGELAGVGAVTGAATALLSQAAVSCRRRFVDPEFEPSVAPPNLWVSSGGLASFFALNAHTRFQLVGGLDQYLFGRSNSMLTYLGITTAARLASNRVGEVSRPGCQGLPEAHVVSTEQRVRRRRAAWAAQAAKRQQLRRSRTTAAGAAGAASFADGTALATEAAVAPPVTSAPEGAVSSYREQSLPGASGLGEAAGAREQVAEVSPARVSAAAEEEAFGLSAAVRLTARDAGASGRPGNEVDVGSNALLASELAGAVARLGVVAPSPAAGVVA